MTVVKPPSPEELVQTYGGLKEAVQHFVKVGFTPEKLEWKLGIPYHLIRLYMADVDPKNPTPLSEVVKVYDRLAVVRSKKGKETELAKFFQTEGLSLEVKTRLALGILTEENLRVGPGIVEKALCLATGTPPRRVRKLLIDYGEHGEVAYLLKKPKEAVLRVEEVYEAVRLLPGLTKIMERVLQVSSLLRVGTPEEAKYIVRLILGDLKLGYHVGTVTRAAAKAYGVPPELIEGACAILGLTEGIMLAPAGEPILSAVKLRPGQFLNPQLAHLYEPDQVGYPLRAELKYDGSRLQLQKWGSRVWLFSRRGIEKSETLPEVAEIVREFKAHSCVVDSEVVATDEEGRFLPFQFLLERTVPGELPKGELEKRKRRVKVTVRAFDILYLNGRELRNLPLSERRKYLLEVVPPEYVAEGRDCRDEVELMRFYEEALRTGMEGIMVKSLSSPYELGQRTYTWLKLKPERDTVDCTIVKAIYGKGRRAGFYSSFLLAVRDPEKKKLYTIGRVSNLPEDVMEVLRDRVKETKVGEDGDGVFVKPSLVVEATYQEIQETDKYTSGFALRVPKIVRFRPDKEVGEIDTLEKLSRLYEMQYDRYPSKTI